MKRPNFYDVIPKLRLLFAQLLINLLLGSLLLWTEEAGNSLQQVGGQLQFSRDDSFGRSEETLAAGFLVLVVVSSKDVVLSLPSQLYWEQSILQCGGLDFLGILLDDRECLLDLGQALVCKLVGFHDVWGNIAVRALQIKNNGLSKLVIDGNDNFDGLLAIRIGFIALDSGRNYG